MKTIKIASAVLFSAILAACAQQEEPQEPIMRGQPIYDKYGSDIIGCEGGIYIPGAAPVDQCLPPDDDCEPTFNAAGQPMPCRPPVRNPNDPLGGSDPQRGRSPNDPTGAAG